MIRTRTAASQRWIVAVLTCALWAAPEAPAQGSASGTRIASKLERAKVIDAYFPEVALEVANALVQAAPDQWRGVQVNQAYRAGWLNIYMIDARGLPENGLLTEEGIDNFTPAALRAGALAHEESGTIFLNTAMWKRLAAATVMTQTKVQPDITAALATIDAVGLDAARKFWDPTTLSANTPANERVGWLMRGALAFVLAHEMGHLRIGRSQSEQPDRLRLSKLTDRQKDEMRACPELMEKESRQRQQHEEAADRAGVALLGAQCRIGSDAKLRHSIYMLGTGWYFLASMSDKLIEMGRNTESPVIAQALRAKLGPVLYQQVIAAHAAEKRRGAVALAFPSSHPPDTERMRAIDAALRATPCGGGGLDSTGAQMLEMYRMQMCRGLIGQAPAR
jgi:hypothetical protein